MQARDMALALSLIAKGYQSAVVEIYNAELVVTASEQPSMKLHPSLERVLNELGCKYLDGQGSWVIPV